MKKQQLSSPFRLWYSASLLLVATLFVASCKKPTEETPAQDFSVATNMYNVQYASDVKQSFNIFLPANRSAETTPVLFLIHGGGWIGGDKNDFNNAIPTLQAMFPNYAIISVGYRLYANGQNRFPTQENDVKACIEYVLNNHATYGISQKFALWGQSAGAHLSLLYGYKHGGSSFMPRVIVDMVGPTDLLSIYYQTPYPDLQAVLLGAIGSPGTVDSLLYKQSSPINYVTPNSPPTLLLYGAIDDLVPYQQADALDAKLTASGVAHHYVLYPNEGHGLSGVAVPALLEAQTFITAHMD